MMKKYMFLILTVPLVILIVLALPGKKSFRLSGEAILDQIGQNTHVVSVHKIKEWQAGGQDIQLVDLRTMDEFAEGHLPEALNLPAGNISTGDIHGFFNDIESNRVLYAEKTYLADRYWILFRQMGIEKLYVLETEPELDSLILHWDSENSRRILVDEDPLFTFQPDTVFNY
jgi:rhodanese-related sulfurtransferase